MNLIKLPDSSRDELSSIELQPFSEQLKPHKQKNLFLNFKKMSETEKALFLRQYSRYFLC